MCSMNQDHLIEPTRVGGFSQIGESSNDNFRNVPNFPVLNDRHEDIEDIESSRNLISASTKDMNKSATAYKKEKNSKKKNKVGNKSKTG